MSLPVPLRLRVGDWNLTDEVQELTFRKEAVGGLRSIAFNLSRPVADLNGVDPLAKVYVHDKDARTVAQGRLSDRGRGAGSDGQKWDCVAFGPVQHASDITTPLVYIDRSLDAGWLRVDVTDGSGDVGVSPHPGFPTETGILMSWSEGDALPNGQRVAYRYDRIWQAGQKLGGFSYGVRNGFGSGDFQTQAVTRTDGNFAGGEVSAADFWSTATLFGRGAYAGGAFPNGRNTVELRIAYTGPGGAAAGNDNWGIFLYVFIRALMLDKAGNELTGSGYQTDDYVLAHIVVADLLGRLLPEYDGANASIDTGGTFQIKQLVYPDGVTPAQVLDDVMKFEPGYRWTTGPDTGNGYAFAWQPWPTTVRYEATLEDGGSFPLSTEDLYNRVKVRYIDPTGATRYVVRSMACKILDDAGVTRQTVIDLGSEAGTDAQAQQAGDAFLAEHNVPKNRGTLNIARPVWDVIDARWVQPWEIEPGELVRVRGVEAYPDAFNTDGNDGQGVFRIFALDYTSDGNASTLALDADPTDTANALKKLQSQRSRA